MNKYMDTNAFLSSLGLSGDETKYGNRNAEHQHRSYSTYMSYEIIDSVEDSLVEEDIVPVVRCKDCNWWKRNRGFSDSPNGHCFAHDDDTNSFDFCSHGERKTDE